MTPLQNALRILILVAAFFLIFLIIWLFYCRCVRRGANEPGGPMGQPLNHAVAEPHRAEGGKYPAFTPSPDVDRNDEFAYPVPAGPVRGTLAPTVSSSQFLKLEKKKEDTPVGGAGDPVVFTDFDPLGNTSNFSGTPPDMNAARGGNIAILSYNSRVQLTTDGAVNWAERDPTTIFPSGATNDTNGNPLDRGFCCDQIVQYVPKIDRFIWLLQFCGTGPGSCLNGINNLRIASASPQDIINNNFTAWTYWDLTSAHSTWATQRWIIPICLSATTFSI
jgi:hypothetical protein